MLCDHAYGLRVATIVSPLSFISLAYPLTLAVWLRESVANACLPQGTCPVYIIYINIKVKQYVV